VEAGAPLQEPISAYLNVRRGLLTNRDLISSARDRLGDAVVPAWVKELAFLRPHEVLEARGVLEGHLLREGILPDSRPLREQIRKEVLGWAEQTAKSGVVEMNAVVPTVVDLFRLCPGYQLSSVSIPVVEFPYPPSNVQNAAELARYLKDNIDELVPIVVGATA
jgi:hypothetical protein